MLDDLATKSLRRRVSLSLVLTSCSKRENTSSGETEDRSNPRRHYLASPAAYKLVAEILGVPHYVSQSLSLSLSLSLTHSLSLSLSLSFLFLPPSLSLSLSLSLKLPFSSPFLFQIRCARRAVRQGIGFISILLSREEGKSCSPMLHGL